MDIRLKKEREGVVMELIFENALQTADFPKADFPKDDIADAHTNYLGPSPYHVNYCGYEPCRPGYKFGPHSRTSFLMHFIFSGKGSYEVGGKVFPLHEQQIFLIYPGETTTYWADTQEPWTYGWIGFNGYRAEYLCSRLGFSPLYPVISISAMKPILNCIQRIMGTHQITFANELYRTAELLRLFAYLEKNRPKEHETAYSYSKSEYADVAMRYLAANFRSKIKISELADHIGVDRSYLSKSFREMYHMSPQEYLIRLRIDSASMLLQSTTDSISDIAASVGYPDALAFSKIFKQRTGLNPSDYRVLNNAPHTTVPPLENPLP